LENVLERAFLFARGPVIEDIALNSQGHVIVSEPGEMQDLTLRDVKRRAVMEVEAKYMQEALMMFRGNITEVAKFMHITTRAVYMKLKTHGMDAMTYRDAQRNVN
jgi:Nif-specific regulatory protein/two-component system response regulator AtoC